MVKQTYVSLDLETTGLKPDSDAIIEVAAVKFRTDGTVDTYSTLVHPNRPLPYRVQLLTGISQEDLNNAPAFSAIAGRLASFIGPHPIVGQSVSFDLAFLATHGLPLVNPLYDTFDLASVLLPSIPDYSLSAVARHLGIAVSIQHRALADASTAKNVFLALLKEALRLQPSIIAEIARITASTDWPLRYFFADLDRAKSRAAFSTTIGAALASKMNLEEMNLDFLTGSSEKVETLVPNQHRQPVEQQRVADLLAPDGPLGRALPNFEHRAEQVQMARQVAGALNKGEHLLAEAGTGTGKSLAYLLPAALYALENNLPIVISTNTINLQEQLINKDIPTLLSALSEQETTELRYTQLKGRSNYVCLRRWAMLRREEAPSSEEAKVLVRLLVWLSSTNAGDRAELNLMPDEVPVWNHICAKGDNCMATQCLYLKRGTCFLYRARRRAEGAHLIVVNHALLLTDIASKSKVLPDYQHLIIDEAHHLEAEATEQFGFHVGPGELSSYLDRLGPGTGGLLSGLRNNFRGSKVPQARQRQLEQMAQETLDKTDAARAQITGFYGAINAFLQTHNKEQGEYDRRLRLTNGLRTQPEWEAVEMAWDNLNLTLMDIDRDLNRLFSVLDSLSEARILDYDNLMAELASLSLTNSDLRRQINMVVSNPEQDYIYWITVSRQNNYITLCTAPLEVGHTLDEALFSQKDSIILTSATLSTEGTFEFIKERLGLSGVTELIVGGPFNYQQAAMIFVPQDIPEPNRPGHQRAIEHVLMDLCRATQGRVLVLFTSYAALKATYNAIKPSLEAERILVLGHGVDGSPKQLLATFKSSPKTVLLGTSSFWEGVDVVGDALSVLVITKLPFTVPTDPIFAARSELFDDAFNRYALPQAVLRFKQGFGRLIRSKTDRGALVILDRRVQTKRYGSAFLDSLPSCTVQTGTAKSLAAGVLAWL